MQSDVQQPVVALEQARLLLEKSKRKRKKRRKRKLPKTSSLRRPCVHAARVPRVRVLPALLCVRGDPGCCVSVLRDVRRASWLNWTTMPPFRCVLYASFYKSLSSSWEWLCTCPCTISAAKISLHSLVVRRRVFVWTTVTCLFQCGLLLLMIFLCLSLSFHHGCW